MHSSEKYIGNLRDAPLHTPQLIAENIFNELKSSGLSYKDILTVSSEILGKLTLDLKDRSENQK